MSRTQPRDLMHSHEIKALVRDAYGDVDGAAGAVARKLYDAGELAQVPQVAIDYALGVANPLRHAEIGPGETLLDLGCGAGLDAILAARRTGPGGRVIALDFLPAMLERVAAGAAEAASRTSRRSRARWRRSRSPTAASTRSSRTPSSASRRESRVCSRSARAFSDPAGSSASPT